MYAGGCRILRPPDPFATIGRLHCGRGRSRAPRHSSVAQWQSIRLLTGGLLVRVQPEEPLLSIIYGRRIFRPIFTLPFCERISRGFFVSSRMHPDARAAAAMFIVALKGVVAACVRARRAMQVIHSSGTRHLFRSFGETEHMLLLRIDDGAGLSETWAITRLGSVVPSALPRFVGTVDRRPASCVVGLAVPRLTFDLAPDTKRLVQSARGFSPRRGYLP